MQYRFSSCSLALLLALGLGSEAYAVTQTNSQSSAQEIIVSLPERLVVVVFKDGSSRSYPAAVGAADTPTPVGRTAVNAKRTAIFERSTGENLQGPVLDLAWPSYIINGMGEANSLGKAVTDGSIELRAEDAAEIFAAADIGTPVEIMSEALDLSEITALAAETPFEHGPTVGAFGGSPVPSYNGHRGFNSSGSLGSGGFSSVSSFGVGSPGGAFSPPSLQPPRLPPQAPKIAPQLPPGEPEDTPPPVAGNNPPAGNPPSEIPPSLPPSPPPISDPIDYPVGPPPPPLDPSVPILLYPTPIPEPGGWLLLLLGLLLLGMRFKHRIKF